MRALPIRHGIESTHRAHQAAAECAGIICYPMGAPENTTLLKTVAAAKPLLFIDCMPEGVEADVVMTDNFGSIQMGLHHLRNQGHHRIAYRGSVRTLCRAVGLF